MNKRFVPVFLLILTFLMCYSCHEIEKEKRIIFKKGESKKKVEINSNEVKTNDSLLLVNLGIKNNDRCYLSKADYPQALLGSSIKIFKPKKFDNNYGADKVYSSVNNNCKYIYKYIDAYFCKVDKSNNKVIDKLKIETTGWCPDDVIPDGIYELDASNWQNVDLMLCVIKESNCCDDPQTFYVIIDSNGKLQILLSIDMTSISTDDGWIEFNESYFIPENPAKESLRYNSEYKNNEEDSIGKIHTSIVKEKMYYNWNGKKLLKVKRPLKQNKIK